MRIVFGVYIAYIFLSCKFIAGGARYYAQAASRIADMSLTAGQLATSVGSTARMEAVTREILSMIDVKLRESDRKFGRNVICVDLEIDFNIPGLSKQDQQRYVYSKVISSLTERGFTAKLSLKPARSQLIVAFEINFNEEEVNSMNLIVKNALLASDEDRLRFIDPESS